MAELNTGDGGAGKGGKVRSKNSGAHRFTENYLQVALMTFKSNKFSVELVPVAEIKRK